MPEYFVVTRSFAAPYFSDADDGYVEGEDPQAALEQVAATYRHPAGLYAAEVYENADAYHKHPTVFLAQWLCNHEQEKRRLTAAHSSYSYLGAGPGEFEVNGVKHVVDNPKSGSVA